MVISVCLWFITVFISGSWWGFGTCLDTPVVRVILSLHL